MRDLSEELSDFLDDEEELGRQFKNTRATFVYVQIERHNGAPNSKVEWQSVNSPNFPVEPSGRRAVSYSPSGHTYTPTPPSTPLLGYSPAPAAASGAIAMAPQDIRLWIVVGAVALALLLGIYAVFGRQDRSRGYAPQPGDTPRLWIEM